MNSGIDQICMSLPPEMTQLLARELLQAACLNQAMEQGEILQRCRKIIEFGAQSLAQELHSRSFNDLLHESIRSRAHRSPRTLAEIYQYAKKLMEVNPTWRHRAVRFITSEDCRKAIELTFHKESMQHKAELILHGIFALAQKRAWVDKNPVVMSSRAAKKKISGLSWLQIRAVLRAAASKAHQPLAAAVGLMLWAGLEPKEIARMTWAHIKLREGVIVLAPAQGGAAEAGLRPLPRALALWLRQSSTYSLPQAAIMPRNWQRRWRRFRDELAIEGALHERLLNTYTLHCRAKC